MENKPLRIDRIIASQTKLSRKDVKKLIKQGLVLADGNLVKSPQEKYNPFESKITLSNEEIIYQKYRYIMMNKPEGIITASEDKFEQTVMDLLPEDLAKEGLFPAGRLDKDTTGFIFITDDGDFAHRMLSPKSDVKKTYLALVDKIINEDDIKKFKEGIVTTHGNIFKPAEIEVIEENDGKSLVKIKISEGKYHQIKRMIASIDGEVLNLHRIKLGGLELDEKLRFGESREINPKELASIM